MAPEALDEAARVFEAAGLREAHARLRTHAQRMAGKAEGTADGKVEGRADGKAEGRAIYQVVEGGGARFAAIKPSASKGWASDLVWFSADDEAALDTFRSIFEHLRLAARFAPVVEHGATLRMYLAFFVVRSACASANMHSDYDPEVGTSALTLMAPLADYATDEDGGFQLLYARTRDRAAPQAAPSRYTYRRGKAIAFGAGFSHSTEPGRAAKLDEPHAFLCFTFGTDLEDRWPSITRTVGYQSRLLANFEGAHVLSSFGREIERRVQCAAAHGRAAAGRHTTMSDEEAPRAGSSMCETR